MKHSFWLISLLVLASVAIQIGSCAYKQGVAPVDYTIRLRWIKSYESESWSDVRTGLIWSFSYLGAALPAGSFDAAVARADSSHFTLDCAKIGFSGQALAAILPMLEQMRQSDEYPRMGGIDLGRFLMFVQQSSWHYYALTGVPETVQAFEQQYFQNGVLHFRLSKSGVARQQRLIRYAKPQTYSRLAFVGEEGSGQFEDNSFSPLGHETIDLMPNGQLRFGIYDKAGNLKAAADTVYTLGGKPGKCQWCHEKSVLPLYFPSVDFAGSLTRAEFLQDVAQAQALIDAFRSTLHTDITYQNPQDHRFAELLTICFLEPSARRLALEWGISQADAELKLAGIPTHGYAEYPFLGQLYHRAEVAHLAPFSSVEVPESAREPSVYEPDVVR